MPAIPRHARFQPDPALLDELHRKTTEWDGEPSKTARWIPGRQCICILSRRKRRGGDIWVIDYECRNQLGQARQIDRRDLYICQELRWRFQQNGVQALKRVEADEQRLADEGAAFHLDQVQNELPKRLKAMRSTRFDMGGSSVRGGVNSDKQHYCHHERIAQVCPACNGESAPMVFYMNEKSGDGRNGKFRVSDLEKKAPKS